MNPLKITLLCAIISVTIALIVAGMMKFGDPENPRLLLILFLNEVGAITSLVALIVPLRFQLWKQSNVMILIMITAIALLAGFTWSATSLWETYIAAQPAQGT